MSGKTRWRRIAGGVARTAVFLVPLLIPGCSGPPELGPEARTRLAAVSSAIDVLAAEVGPLDLAAEARERNPAVETFLAHYGLPTEVEHRTGFVEVPSEAADGSTSRVLAHVWRPEGARRTVVVVHGYYDHAGMLGPAVRALVDAGYAVVAFDLPGHGLSDGARAAVESFAEYRRALDAVLAAVEGAVPRPWSLVGHSTGGAVAIDRLLIVRDDSFERTVLAAPLVRSAYWGLSRTGAALVGWFVDDVRRFPRDDTSDEEALRFRRQEDPLRHDRFPLDWYDALVAWVEEVEAADPVDEEVLVVQGEADDTVSWKRNLEVLAEKFPRGRVERIPGANHQLFHESEEYRARTFEVVLEFLGGGESGNRPTPGDDAPASSRTEGGNR